MAGLGVLLRKELLEQWRTLRLPLVAIVFLLIGFLSPLLARFTPEILRAVGGGLINLELPPPSAGDAIDQLAKNLGQLGALIAILLAAGAVATEKDRGTAALLLTRPVGRAGFLVAKLVAIGITLAISTAVAVAAAWFYTLVLFEQLSPGGTVAAAVMNWLALLAWAAITLLASTLTRSALAAAGIGFVALILIGILGIVPAIAPWLPTGLAAAARALWLGVPGPEAWTPIVGTLLLIAACLVLAWLAFRRQEL
ncbi:MAG TPA: ABC transporter permease subunit [Candidatus Limnocylindrales bacterium]|jgi:ABC-2 type transport system permease protein